MEAMDRKANVDPDSVDPRDRVDPADLEDQTAQDAARLAQYAAALADAIEAAIPAWVERSVVGRYEAWLVAGGADPEPAATATIAAVRADARQAGEMAQADVGPRVRHLLLADIDEQRTNPLAIVRGAVTYPTDVLRRARVPPVVRDAQAELHFPADDYDLTPGAFTDLDPALHEPGLMWGAAKAHVHLRRRRAEGRR